MDFKNLPPCKSSFLNKIQRSNYLAHMIKYSSENNMSTPKSGWVINENGEFEIEYFTCTPYPETVADVAGSEDSDDDREDRLNVITK